MFSAVCDIPCLQYWRQISAAFPKARWAYQDELVKAETQSNSSVCSAFAIYWTLFRGRLQLLFFQVGADSEGTIRLVSVRRHNPSPSCRTDWQVLAGWSFFWASVDFFIPMVTSSAFQVELVVALHVLGSLPEQLPDQTPGHSLQVEFDTFSWIFK